jgi:hypothetical protein
MKQETVGLEDAQVMAKTIVEMFKEAEEIRSKETPAAGETDTTPYEAQINALKGMVKQLEETPLEDREAQLLWGPLQGTQMNIIGLEKYNTGTCTVRVARESTNSVLATVTSIKGLQERKVIRPGTNDRLYIMGDLLNSLHIMGLFEAGFAFGDYIPYA